MLGHDHKWYWGMFSNVKRDTYDPEANTGIYLANLNRKPEVLDINKPTSQTQHPNDQEWAMG